MFNYGDGTMAVSTDLISNYHAGVNRSYCPACRGGRLHPYKLSVNLGGFQGMASGSAWVAVCAGADPALHESEEPLKPCGFSVPLVPSPSVLLPRP